MPRIAALFARGIDVIGTSTGSNKQSEPTARLEKRRGRQDAVQNKEDKRCILLKIKPRRCGEKEEKSSVLTDAVN